MNREQHEMLVRIDERVDLLLKHKNDHESRLRSLEVMRNWFAGVLAAVGSILGYSFRPPT